MLPIHSAPPTVPPHVTHAPTVSIASLLAESVPIATLGTNPWELTVSPVQMEPSLPDHFHVLHAMAALTVLLPQVYAILALLASASTQESAQPVLPILFPREEMAHVNLALHAPAALPLTDSA